MFSLFGRDIVHYTLVSLSLKGGEIVCAVSLKSKIGLLGIISLGFIVFICCSLGQDRPYREAALEAARWIAASQIQAESGITWPSVPGDNSSVNNTLYSGNPGVILFMLEAYFSTEDPTYLETARSGADYLLATLESEKIPGLYMGISGIGFALGETYKATRTPKYRTGMEVCLRFLKEASQKEPAGLEWGTTTDIISGTAGTGLFLLYAGRTLQEPAWIELAAEAGSRLIQVGQPVEAGIKWAMDPQYPRLMPNFSHGTAGIAYFLSSLYLETQNQEFLTASLAGARYLQTIAHTEGDSCLIFHHEPEGEELYYLGWCHGPVGTARLFYRLFTITEDAMWLDWAEKGAAAILNSGIPEKQTPGFWNNVGVCCGSAGVADFFLSLYQVTKKPKFLEFARRMTTQILAKSTPGVPGLKWIQAEHRSRPDFLQAQTGLMQGAAGIGLWLLKLDAFDQDQVVHIQLPDNPFR